MKTISYRRKYIFVFLVVIFAFLVSSNCFAGTIRVLSVNGDKSLNGANYFQKNIIGYYVNGLPVQKGNVKYLNQPGNGKLMEALTGYVGKTKKDDVFLFYFNGHGCGEAFYYNANNYMYYQTLYKALKSIAGTKIVIIDCCGSGGFIDANRELAGNKQFLVLTASDAYTYSPFYTTLLTTITKTSVSWYMKYVSEAIGFGNKNLKAGGSDQIVTQSELYTYLKKNYMKKYSYNYKGKKGTFFAIPLIAGSAKATISRKKSPILRQ